jgi:hypothetical protein
MPKDISININSIGGLFWRVDGFLHHKNATAQKVSVLQ